MKRLAQKLVRGLVCLGAGFTLLLALFVLEEHVRGEWALNARLKSLALNGEVLAVASLKPPSPAPDQNLFTDLLALTNQLKAAGNLWVLAPPVLRLSSPAHAVVAAKLEEWSDDGKTTKNWQKLGDAAEQAREAVASLEAASRKPAYDTGFDYDKGFVEFKSAPIWLTKQSCQVLSFAVLHSLRQGNLGAAHDALTALVDLVAKQTPERLIINQLVRQACAVYAFDATWQALQADGWTDAQLASLQAAWQPCDFVKDMALSLEMERAMDLDLYRQVRGSRQKLDRVVKQRVDAEEAFGGLFGTLPAGGLVLNWLYLPLWRAAWAGQDELASLERWQFINERERRAVTNGWAALTGSMQEAGWPWSLSAPDTDKQGGYGRLRFLFSGGPFGVDDSTIRRTLEAQTEQQMALAALGIQRYRVRTGHLPSQLSDLVPDCLAAVPRDLMDAGPLKYRLLPGDAGFLLYSAGEDGKDDGGDPAWQQSKNRHSRIWDGRDAVWPAAAGAEEAKAAVTGRRPQ